MDSNCIFCKIILGEIPAQVVAQNDSALAFVDQNPQAPTHLLIIPKKHLSQVDQATEEDRERLGSLVLFANQVAQDQGLTDYRLVINNGESAGQTVFHLHLHLLGGREFKWPPG